MRFRGTTSPTPFWNRKFQFRMILMVLSLSLVIVAIQKASDPAFWAVWFPEETSDSQSGELPPPVTTARDAQGGPLPKKLERDEILIAVSQNSADDIEEPTTPETQDVPPEQDSSSELPILKHDTGPREVPVDLARLHSIEDNAVGIRPSEAEPFYYLLDHASHVPLEELSVAGQTKIAREALLNSPDHYRGTPIQLEGELRRLEIMEATPNIFEVQRYFDGWILPQAAGNIPWRVVSLDIDGTLPIAETIEESVRVRITGYFFKLQGYAANSGLMITPVLVARKIERVPPRAENPLLAESSNTWKWLLIGFGVVFVVAVWSVVRSNLGSRKTREYRKQTLESSGDLSAFAGKDSFQPESHLQQVLDRNDREE